MFFFLKNNFYIYIDFFYKKELFLRDNNMGVFVKIVVDFDEGLVFDFFFSNGHS